MAQHQHQHQPHDTPPPIPWYSHPRYNSLGVLASPFSTPSTTPGPATPFSGSAVVSRGVITPDLEPIRPPVNAVYYPNYRIYKQQPPSSLQLQLTSHVFYAFAWVKPDGTVYLSDEWADTQLEVDGTQGCLRSFQQLKVQYDHLKVILSVGGGGKGSDNFATVAASPSCRERFAQSARALVDEFGLDGIDIDWEHPADSRQGHAYTQLLSALRRYLPTPRYILTSALPAGEWALQHIPIRTAAESLDMIMLMTYDFSGPWTDQSGHHAQLYTPRHPHNDQAVLSCDSSVNYVLRQAVPPEKIALGIPAYGRSFLQCKDVGQEYCGHAGEEGTFEYKDLPRKGAKEYVDMTVGAAYSRGGDGGWVSYDNVQTVKMKAAYAKDRDLAGVFFWTGTADKKGDDSLVGATFTALHCD